jgi:class 3 adenylate cyclase
MDPVVVVVQPGRQALYLVVRDPLVVGRECEGLVLADAQVSRRHLELRADGGRVVATDLGSTNGSFIDGARITGPVTLAPGHSLTLGETVIRTFEPPPAAAPGGVGRSTTIAMPDDLRRTSIDLVADLVTAEPPPSHTDSDTVTILFSDIESHTERVAGMGDAAWIELLEKHNRVFRDELADARGREVKAQGDGFMLTFTSVRRALAFAIAVQKRLAEHSAAEPDRTIRVRMGLHTGEAIADRSGDLFGRHVIKAARVANLAAGGQILVSETVREIASGDHEVEFGAGAEVELKGLDGTHLVHDVFWS